MFARIATALSFFVLTALLCSAAAADYRAVATRNGLASKYPVRGFGDSNKVDVWVLFRINTGGTSARSATLTMVVKPIGQLIGTDALLVRGASGKVHNVYKGFSSLPANRWSTVRVDLSRHPDVMNAIRGGRLDGVIQDDTAVHSVTLSTSGSGATSGRTAVYVWDVYYWGAPNAWSQPSWIRYQSYYSAGDATRAIQSLNAQGYSTTWKKRFWRWGGR